MHNDQRGVCAKQDALFTAQFAYSGGKQRQKLAGLSSKTIGSRFPQLGFATETPEHPDIAHRVMTSAFDIHMSIADHPAVGRIHCQSPQRLGDQIRLVAQSAVWGGADDVFEMVAEW